MHKLICILLSAAAAFTLASCERRPAPTKEAVTSYSSTQTDKASLNAVEPPVFCRRFAVMYSQQSACTVDWGAPSSVLGAFFYSDSGYPGFGYPIVICVGTFNCGDSVNLKTMYGDYYYEQDASFRCRVVDNKLVGSDGLEIVPAGRKGEVLFLYNDFANTVYRYIYLGGTKITV